MSSKGEIVARECRFVVHIPARHNVRPDLHLIKEQLHYSDGTTEPNLRLVKDFKRSFWVTKKQFQNHKEKKECEALEFLNEYECTESELRDKVAQVLDQSYTNDYLKKLSRSPYLYGSDISAAALIKKYYMDKYPEHRSPFSVAQLDIETKNRNGHTIITIITVTYNGKVFTGVLKDIVKGIADVKLALASAMKKYLPNAISNITEDVIEIFDNEVDMLRATFQRLHAWKPDFVAIWNMDYDIPKILDTLERHRVDPIDILCDPSLDRNIRICKYIQGQKKKITASGKVTPISPASQWHTLILTASFYVIDPMCVYKFLRLAKQEQPSYSLDWILQVELGSRKLSFTAADQYNGLKWHEFMSDHYPIEYIVYNRWDCLSMAELDNKIKDLCMTLPEFAGVTEFRKFNSQPKKIADALFFHWKNLGYILGTVGARNDVIEVDVDGNEIAEEDPSLKVLPLTGWICTLKAELQVSGLRLIMEDNFIQTNLRGMVYDSDAVAAYPTVTDALGTSKANTVRELIAIEGIRRDIFTMQNINLLAGPVNAIEYGMKMFGLPHPDEVLKIYISEKNH